MKEFNDNMTPLDRVDRELADKEGIMNERNMNNWPSAMQKPCLDNKDRPLAMVYSPMQMWRNIYTPDEALRYGTLFAELNFPWEAGEKGSKWNDK